MHPLQALIDNNKRWATARVEADPQFFQRLAAQQSPEYLWIGCSDSRVPANEVVGLAPGELFVHRNVANVVVHTDLNCLSVLQFAIDVLRVKHVIVCGHYNCGGIRAALDERQHGLIDNWLRHVEDVAQRNADELAALGDLDAKVDRLCELNAMEQVRNVARSTVVQDAWRRGQSVTLHAWCYGLRDGLVHDLGVSLSSAHMHTGR